MSETGRPANHLIDESSPYLLQHAHNPVDWYPWGAEALDRSRRENRPIFLSVGYSTCYWCHVMERQCFENPAVAAEMNRLFINIKVDREERPDVDQLYMTAVQLLSRHAGWPMSVWLTPELEPFYGGTYFPPDRFVALLRALDETWRNRSAEVANTTGQIVSVLRRLTRPEPTERAISPDAAFLASLIERSVSDYDSQDGGFGGAPKFPRQTLLELLLTAVEEPSVNPAGGNLDAMLRRTLDAMADGGIHDQLGGGFHRYSTDARWLVPHFEIMLYDNAMLAWIYAESHRRTQEPRDARVARGILDFVLREMTSPDGAFYTAFDAEVDTREGQSYLWTAAQIEDVLGASDAALFNRVYGVDRGPNFADPHHGTGRPDQNILYLPRPMREAAAEAGRSESELEEQLAPMRQKLSAARAARRQPMLDTKILTSWNALMIRALAHGGRVLNEPRYIQAAERAAKFLLEQHRFGTDGLYRVSRDGRAKTNGFLDDYAFLAQAVLSLHEATGDPHWREEAESITAAMTRRFGGESGGLFFTDAESDDLILRQVIGLDSPQPSGNSVATMVLMSLGRFDEAGEILRAFLGQVSHHGESMSSMVQAMILHRRSGVTGNLEPSKAATEKRSADEEIIAIEPRWIDDRELHVVLDVRPPYHLNAHEPGDEKALVPTVLTVRGATAEIDYPPGTEFRADPAGPAIRVYTGRSVISVRFSTPPKAGSTLQLSLSCQPCDDRACLAPVTRRLEISAPGPA